MSRALARSAACALLLCALALMLAHLRTPVGESLRFSPNPLRCEESSAPALPCGPVAINRASVEELEALPRIGPALAQSIVRQREENGLFAYPQDLLCVKGIGQKTLAKLWDCINLSK